MILWLTIVKGMLCIAPGPRERPGLGKHQPARSRHVAVSLQHPVVPAAVPWRHPLTRLSVQSFPVIE